MMRLHSTIYTPRHVDTAVLHRHGVRSMRAGYRRLRRAGWSRYEARRLICDMVLLGLDSQVTAASTRKVAA